MTNNYILSRLDGIHNILKGVHKASSNMTNTTKGEERQAFINSFLNAVFPNQFRFGSGEATDINGNRSGQLDVVIENSFSPSLPSVVGNIRLYPAESIGAVIEVKSNISAQWDQALLTAQQLAPITRNFGSAFTMDSPLPIKIPLFIVSYTGWTTLETIKNKLIENPNISGILVIDKGLFSSLNYYGGELTAWGPWGLWGLICCLYQSLLSMQAMTYNLINYAQ